MPQEETYISFEEYLESQPGSVVLFVLLDYRGKEINRQVVPYTSLEMRKAGEYTAKFVVDDLLTMKMHPGNYKLFLYVGLPKDPEEIDIKPEDYTFAKCLTEKGIEIRVRGGLQEPSVGAEEL